MRREIMVIKGNYSYVSRVSNLAGHKFPKQKQLILMMKDDLFHLWWSDIWTCMLGGFQ